MYIKQADRACIEAATQAVLEDLRYCSAISVLARNAGMGETKFRKLFRLVNEQSFYEFFQHHRFKQARAMLAGSDKSIKEIAYLTGYNNSSFVKAFKKKYGMAPAAWRKQNFVAA